LLGCLAVGIHDISPPVSGGDVKRCESPPLGQSTATSQADSTVTNL